MKKLLFPIIVFLFASCQQQKNESSFIITGTIQELDNGTVYLHTKRQSIDLTSEIENEGFVFEGNVTEPCRCELTIDGVDGSIIFWLENSDIEIEANKDSLNKAVIKGSKMQSDQVAYEKILEAVKTKYNIDGINEEYGSASEEHRAELDQIFNAYEEDLWEAKKQFVVDNPSSYYSTIILWDIDWMFSPDEFERFISQLDTSLNGFSYYEEIKDIMRRLKDVEVGQIAPDFTMNDTDGNPVVMSQICKESKYLLIDFWASSCSPCRIENKNLVKIYKKFHDKGLNILSVSTDVVKEDWLEAIEKDSIDKWVNVCNLKKWDNNEIVKLYVLQQVSENLLIDNTGKIILRNMKGEELQNRLEELLTKKE